MAIAFDAVGSQSGSGTGPFTWSHTCSGSDRILFVVAAVQASGQTFSGCTYNGVAMTEVAQSANNSPRFAVFRLVAPATGTNTVSLSPSGSIGNTGRFVSVSYTGVDQTTPLGTAVSSDGTSTAPSVTVSSASGELVFGGIAHQTPDTTTLTWDSGENERVRVGTGGVSSHTRTAGADEAGAASVTMSATLGASVNWKMLAVPMKPAAGGGGSDASAVLMRHYEG